MKRIMSLKIWDKNENRKSKRRLSWYGMKIFLYQFVLTFLPVILISAFATYIYVSKSKVARTQYICGEITKDELKNQIASWYTQGGNDVIAEVNAQYKK